MTSTALGVAAGALLFLVLSGGRLRRRVRPATGVALAAGGAVEELLWRGVAFDRLSPALGATGALAVTTVGFAASHVPSLGLRGGLVHLATGGVFGSVLLGTGHLEAAVASHAAYNAMLAVGGGPGLVASLRGVHKRLGAVDALQDVDLELRRGEILVLLGPNGAGKTTLASILLGLRRPDGGSVSVTGIAGATPQGMSFPPTVRVREIIEFARSHYRAPASADDLLSRFELRDLERRQTGGLSGGELRRLAVALAFAGRPDLVVLDEPTTGLDLESRRAVWTAVRNYAAGGGAVLLTTHSLEEARELADRVVVLVHGRVVAEGSPGELTREERLLELMEAEQ
ncbi:MAG: ATP-binding cassette domain-containing protein [Gaiellaceae bacterium]